ncbi:hypothetical protein H5410_041379 [Solanum commersonii]|uniref:Uncharacterized protein n=1 Tax=Solanum commersonii TaxID=4109 RepID=A0A9J5XRN6_SOLCO|nr:hypothetical protein H5410_041379 [Solanum commersonii]
MMPNRSNITWDHSVQLVGITDALDDLPFDLLQLLPSASSRSESLGLSTLELWARLRPFGDSPNALGDPQDFFSSSFQPFCSILPSSVHALPQTPNT